MIKHLSRAYTLFEVLASVAIIAILAAILFTSYGTGMRQAKTSVCISNLQQIHHAINLYRDDHGEYPPSSIKWPGLQPYFGFVTLKCPVMVEPSSLGDYGINTFLPPDIPSAGRKRACMELRGPDFPIGFDFNHMSPLVLKHIDDAILLVLRQGGSVDRRPVQALAGCYQEGGDGMAQLMETEGGQPGGHE